METATAVNGWVNTIDSQNPEAIAQARCIINNNIYCTLSTCSVDGFPWVSPVFFAYDHELNIYWSSAITSKHSENLYTNHGRVAIAIYNAIIAEGSPAGVYFTGIASELNSDLIETAFQLLANRARKPFLRTAADYLHDSPRRIYQFQPEQVWITGDRIPLGNQLIDTKIQLNLVDLRQE